MTTGYTKQEKEPASAAVTEVAPGVLRMQLPISMPGLGHVNCYAIEDGDGVAVVDPGLPGPASWRALQTRLTDGGIPLRRVHTVFVTHSHPDHFGGVERLRSESGARVVAHREFGSMWAREGGRPSRPWDRPTPWGGRMYKPPLRRRLAYRVLGRAMGSRWQAPDPSDRVDDEAPVRLAGREWRVLHTPGHTLDHICLLDPEAGILLSGDHVLPTITPHISGVGTGPDPLSEFLASLDRVAALDGVHVVLPAHGHPFDDLGGRVKDIKRHHEERLTRLREASHDLGPATVEQLAEQLFKRRSWGPMAHSETYAHLEHLRMAGEAERYHENDRLLYVVNR